MRKLISFAAGYTFGYLLVTKLAPIVQAKIQSADLDSLWDVYDDVWSGRPE